MCPHTISAPAGRHLVQAAGEDAAPDGAGSHPSPRTGGLDLWRAEVFEVLNVFSWILILRSLCDLLFHPHSSIRNQCPLQRSLFIMHGTILRIQREQRDGALQSAQVLQVRIIFNGDAQCAFARRRLPTPKFEMSIRG